MFHAVKERASDIHIEPGEKDVIVRYRIDGVLYETRRAARQFIPSIISRVKIMAGLNIAEKRLPQDGRIRRKIAGKDIDMRVATAPTVKGGERITIRLLDRETVLLDLADIGFGDDHLTAMDELITRPHGILLVTGPTGSGKTTTLYACLAKINSPDLNILTIEDPVEYQLEGISQVAGQRRRSISPSPTACAPSCATTPTSSWSAKSATCETAEIAIQASLTGHLVLSTIHTNDAAGAITRLVDMGVQPFLVASSLMALLAQRLVRRLCRECRELYRPTEERPGQPRPRPRRLLRRPDSPPALQGRRRSAAARHALPRARGRLPACLNAGYKGRTAIYELLMIDDRIRQLAIKNADAGTIKRAAIEAGMRTLREDGAQKVLAGMTTAAEVMMITTGDSELGQRHAGLRLERTHRRGQDRPRAPASPTAPRRCARRCARRTSSSPRCARWSAASSPGARSAPAAAAPRACAARSTSRASSSGCGRATWRCSPARWRPCCTRASRWPRP